MATLCAMPNATLPAKPETRFKVYSNQQLMTALDNLAAVNKARGKKLNSRSKLLNHVARMFLRRPDNVTALRRAGISLPAELLEKK